MMTKEQLESVTPGYNCLELVHGDGQLFVGSLVGKADCYMHEENGFTGLWYVLDGQFPIISSDWRNVKSATVMVRGGDRKTLSLEINYFVKRSREAFRLHVLTAFAPVEMMWKNEIPMSFMLHRVVPLIPEGDLPGYMELIGYDHTNNVWREIKLEDVYPPRVER